MRRIRGRFRSLLLISLFQAASCLAPAPSDAWEPHLLILTSNGNSGGVDSMGLDSPWAVQQDRAAADGVAVARTFEGRHYVVNRHEATVQVLDAGDFGPILEFPVGDGSEPADILVLEPHRAFVSRYGDTLLWEVDPSSGDLTDTVDLAIFADPDGLPEMSRMARDGDRLFVQIQRRQDHYGPPVPPSLLAVVDLRTNELLDADPGTPGVQGIELEGTVPSFRMHVDSQARRLFVSAPGMHLEVAGGIEEIDLDSLQSLGFVLSEESVGADLGPMVMLSPDHGYAVFHTDIVPSSHLIRFDRTGPPHPSEITVTFQFIRSMAYDPVTAMLYFPDPEALPSGITVVDTLTDTVLTSVPVPTSRPPWDLLVARGTTPGEAAGMRVEGRDPATGTLTLLYEPACMADNHNIVYGPLELVDAHAWLDQVCGIGTGGRHAGFDPGEGSWFFLVAGTDGAGRAGSYGRTSEGVERPEITGDPDCHFAQDLSDSCS